MKDVNIFVLTGNLGRDSELRYTPQGTPVLNFSIANDQSWKNEEGVEQKRVNWVNCVVFGKRAEAIQKFLLKGARILIEGKMSVRQYQDKDDRSRVSTEIVVDREGEIQVLRFVNNDGDQGGQGARPPAGGSHPEKPGSQTPPPAPPPEKGELPQDDSLPF